MPWKACNACFGIFVFRAKAKVGLHNLLMPWLARHFIPNADPIKELQIASTAGGLQLTSKL